ncbi:hypothetical protein QJS10_CPB15g00709 [Acorus calamus]|uniref:Uncharacterized protein n=1 Tax=Acorus calamus TaxID=4465 RepID=A0AAV9D8P7_ACOCL|nr:hypothetical protein QJS10_CPB15g00709 [Acorus calamus]
MSPPPFAPQRHPLRPLLRFHQRHVSIEKGFVVSQFLSMKLASVNPVLYDFGMDLDDYMVQPEYYISLLTSWAGPQIPTPSLRGDDITTFDASFSRNRKDRNIPITTT